MSESSSLRAQRHSRNLRLQRFGVDGQERLAQSRVAVVGAGGLGAPVIAYLAAAGVGRLTVIDDDRVELSNLNRQVLFRTVDVGHEKATCAAHVVTAMDDDVRATAVVERVTTDNVHALISSHDVVVDCTDGLPAKFLLNDACVSLRIPLIHGAVTAFDGQVVVVEAGGKPCLRCLFPTLPPPDTVPTCQTVGVLGAAVGVVGSLLALEALKLLSACAPPLVGRFMGINLETLRFSTLTFPPRAECRACGSAADLDGRDPEEYTGARC